MNSCFALLITGIVSLSHYAWLQYVFLYYRGLNQGLVLARRYAMLNHILSTENSPLEFTKQTRLAPSQYPPGPGLCLSAYRLGDRELLLTSEPSLQPQHSAYLPPSPGQTVSLAGTISVRGPARNAGLPFDLPSVTGLVSTECSL